MSETFTQGQVDTAMCLWEAWLDLLALAKDPMPDDDAVKAKAYMEGNGSCTMRSAIVDLVVPCDDAWQAVEALAEEAPVFDWEWCPDFIRASLHNGLIEQAVQAQYQPKSAP